MRIKCDYRKVGNFLDEGGKLTGWPQRHALQQTYCRGWAMKILSRSI